MRERLLALAERRAHLVARAQAERESVARLLAPTDAMSSMATSFFHAVRRIFQEARKYPLLALAGGAVLAAIRPRRTIGWIANGWSLYQLYRGLAPVIQRFAATAGAPAGRPRHQS
ncbi:MAG: hypothetical protein EXR30_05705 [Betaproteobacteria bacterium]|nr:hypothetical protein [Betaproteobacteria bacterium]MSQ89730.1 hypothetical protein [Betaproteobacteria bacterium]